MSVKTTTTNMNLNISNIDVSGHPSGEYINEEILTKRINSFLNKFDIVYSNISIAPEPKPIRINKRSIAWTEYKNLCKSNKLGKFLKWNKSKISDIENEIFRIKLSIEDLDQLAESTPSFEIENIQIQDGEIDEIKEIFEPVPATFKEDANEEMNERDCPYPDHYYLKVNPSPGCKLIRCIHCGFEKKIGLFGGSGRRRIVNRPIIAVNTIPRTPSELRKWLERSARIRNYTPASGLLGIDVELFNMIPITNARESTLLVERLLHVVNQRLQQELVNSNLSQAAPTYKYTIEYCNDIGTHSRSIAVDGTVPDILQRFQTIVNQPMTNSITIPHLFSIRAVVNTNIRGGYNGDGKHDQFGYIECYIDGQNYKIKSLSPQHKLGNCALACIKRFLKINKLKPEVQKMRMNNLRKKAGIKHQQGLTPDEFKVVSTFYGLNLQLHYLDTHCNLLKFNNINETVKEGDVVLDVLYEFSNDGETALSEGHYSMITGLNEFIYCPQCGQFLRKDNETHNCNAAVKSYWNKQKLRNKVKYNGPAPIVYKQSNVYGYDFETSTNLGKNDVQVPYCVVLMNNESKVKTNFTGKECLDQLFDTLNKLEDKEIEQEIEQCKADEVIARKKIQDELKLNDAEYIYEKEKNKKGRTTIQWKKYQAVEQKVTEAINNRKILLASYNGCRFDDQIMLGYLDTMKDKMQLKHESFDYEYLDSHSRVLNLIWTNSKGYKIRHFDICNFIVGKSLRDAAKEFGCNVQKGDFNYDKIINWNSVEQYKPEYVEYCEKDVVCMMEVLDKLRASHENVYGTDDMLNYLTSSQLTYDKWLDHISTRITTRSGQKGYRTNVTLEIPQQKTNEYIRKSIYGGQVYPLQEHYQSSYMNQIEDIKQDEKKDDTIKEKLLQDIYKKMEEETDYGKLYDVVSLYPTVMSQCNNYPLGQSVYQEGTAAEKSFKDKQCGFYEIDYITNKKLRRPVLPSHDTESEGLSWHLEDGSGIYALPDILRAVRHGYKIKIKTAQIYYSSGNPFGHYIDKIFKLKKYQDVLKNKQDIPEEYKEYESIYGNNYNQVLRELCKLMMNGLYGKTIQRAEDKIHMVIRTNNDYCKFISQATAINVKFFPIADEFDEDGQLVKNCKLYVTGTKYESQNSKPCQLGSYILANTRDIMFNYYTQLSPNLQNHTGCYGDTDSIIAIGQQCNILNKHIGQGLGQLSDDTKGAGFIYKAIFLAPKTYMYRSLDKNGKIHTVMKCKGIPVVRTENGELIQVIYEEWYEDKKPHDVSYPNAFKKHLHLTNIDIDKGIKCGDISKIAVDNTFNKEAWTKWNLVDGIYYPKGYQAK